ncbi:MAG: VWA domain-containing protein [Treponema sp.]|nr:VWA domain-containing protein [Treponema sp.]
MMFSFQNPSAFYLLLLIPVLFILRKLKIFTKITFPAVLSDWNGKSFEWKEPSRKFFSAAGNLLLLIAFLTMVAAFADPKITHQEKIYTTLGTDVVFVVDTSPSMAAKDVNGGNRLEAAKKTIRELLVLQDGFRYGVVALGSQASVLVPPTSDKSVFNKRLEELQVGFLGNGSAIGDGLSTAVCHLASSSAPKRCIILLTDGENNSGEIHPETAANLAKANKIKIFVVGIGTKGSVPIEYTDPVTGRLYAGYLDSNFNSDSLQKIAALSEGRYFEARTTEELLSTLSVVAKTESVAQSFTYRSSEQLYYDKFLLVAVILFVVSWILKRVLLNETV